MEENGTDRTAGAIARFYIHGRSTWEIVFAKDNGAVVDPAPPDDGNNSKIPLPAPERVPSGQPRE